jgi:two-component system, NarL family, nitrate/nitrite response regulator NarL
MRLVVLSNRRLFGESLAAVLKSRPEVRAVSRVAEPESLLSLCELAPFDVAVIDANRDVSAVVPICRQLRDRFPAIYLVVMYETVDPADLSALRASGVCALVPCSRGLTALLATLHSRPAEVRWPQPTGLSGRQRDVLMLLGSGHSVVEIAALLGITPGTVENHKRRLYAKLEAATGVQAVARAVALGIIDEGLSDSRELPARPAPDEPGRPLVVVAYGNGEPVLQVAIQILIRHGLPVAREHRVRSARSDHWLRWHRGPVVVLLVDPDPADWRTAQSFHRPVVVVYSDPADQAELGTALSTGAAAALTADWVDDRLVHLLKVVAEGYLVVGREQAHPLLRRAGGSGPAAASAAPGITAREHDILRSIGQGHTIRETARTLGIAVKTVANAQSHLFRKLGAHNRPSALVAAHSYGLLPDPPAAPAERPVAAWRSVS